MTADVIDVLRATGLFDDNWYLTRHSDVVMAGLDPLSHWCNFGSFESRRPNPYFDPAWYLSQNPDVAASGLNPLLHYGLYGDREGRRPGPNFDPAWYRRAYSLSCDQIALRHFLDYRLSGNFIPCPALFAVPFLDPYDCMLASGHDPFDAFLEQSQRPRQARVPDYSVIANSRLLDTNFYLINGTDIHESGLDPLDHFVEFGWREGRKPNMFFDTRWYIATNQDVARLEINPLTHYILKGERDGRRPVVYFDPVWYRVTYGLDDNESALAHYMTYRRSQKFSPTPEFDVIWYVSRNRHQIGPNRDPFAHYLLAGTLANVDPSPRFSASEYRRRHLGRPSRSFPQLLRPERHNPLVHYLLAGYT